MNKLFTLNKIILSACATLGFMFTNIAPSCAENLTKSIIATQNSSTAQVVLDNKSFVEARGRVGEKVEVGTVHITATDLPEGVKLLPSSKINGIFTTDIVSLPSGNSETDVTIYYEAKKIGKDEGRIYITLGDDYLEEIKLSGLAIDPATPPTLNVDATQLSEFNTKVGESVEQTITATIKGFPSSVDVKVTQEKPGFTVNTGILYYSVETHKLRITFYPKEVGNYEAEITFSNEFVEPVIIKVKGTATDGSAEPEKEGDELPLTYDNPVTLLDEHFNDVTHNKPLSIEGWKNIAAIGQRAWWGYTFPEYEEDNAGENVAKITAYDSKMEAGLNQECQMLLATPPLNLKDAASKIFTFRVMGKFLLDKMTETLTLCTLTYEDGNLMAYPIEGVTMPYLPDESGKWQEYQVDLTNLQLGDVCHLGFLLSGMRGPDHSTTYYIDDVTFGRTDIPMIKTDKEEVVFNSVEGAFAVSEEVNVTATNLTEDIHITLEGKYKDDFELSHTTLPKEGGKFFVGYESSYKEGYYGVYAKLTSKGAVTKNIAFFATIISGIESVEITENDIIEIYDINGTKISKVRGITVVDTVEKLPKGTYIIRISRNNQLRTLKITR